MSITKETDLTGMHPIPNGDNGVWLSERGAEFNRIGGTRPEERNVISANGKGGIVISSAANVIRGNFIGTDATGRAPLGNAGGGAGVGEGNIFGGTTPQEANVVAASGWNGVGAGHNSIVVGNVIGTDPASEVDMGNLGLGVICGGRTIIQGNVIAHTKPRTGGGGTGIVTDSDARVTMRRNRVYDSAGAGIENGPQPPAPPVIVAATGFEVTGTACAGCEIEIFSDFEDEGRWFEGSTVADASGHFAVRLRTLARGRNLTATATDRMGSTSRFSAPHPAPPRPLRRKLGPR